LAHGRCIEGISPLGWAESSIDCCPQTRSFIHAGGDHGEAYTLSVKPRALTSFCACLIIGIIPESTSCLTPPSKWASEVSPNVSSKEYEAGLKSHELIGTRPSV